MSLGVSGGGGVVRGNDDATSAALGTSRHCLQQWTMDRRIFGAPLPISISRNSSARNTDEERN